MTQLISGPCNAARPKFEKKMFTVSSFPTFILSTLILNVTDKSDLKRGVLFHCLKLM